MDELKPCPFCGSTRINMHGNQANLLFWLACKTCGSEGPTKSTKEESIKAWNASHTAQHPAEPETVGDNEALFILLESEGYDVSMDEPDSYIDERACDVQLGWQAALSHERATVRELKFQLDGFKAQYNTDDKIINDLRATVREAVRLITTAIEDLETLGRTDKMTGPLLSFLATHKPEKETGGEFCDWFESDEGNAWESSCGEIWYVGSGGPLENGHKFCPQDGKPIRIKDGRDEN